MGRHATRTITARTVPAVMAAAARTRKVIERQADPTLYLRVRAGGRSAAWIQRVRIAGRTVAKGLGSFPVITFQAAKQIALRNRAELAAGRNPFAARVRTVVRTFATAAESCRAAHLPRWSNASVKAFDSVVRNQLAPLAALPLAGITRERVVDVLAGITNDKQARKARQRAGQILEHARSRGWIDTNPADARVLAAALPALRNQATDNYRTVSADQVPAVLAHVAATVPGIVSDCLTLQVLAGVRPSEAREAEWSEIDFDTRIWTIPGERMKMDRPHRVPLSAAAVDVLTRRQGLHATYVFPSMRTGRPIGANRVLSACKSAPGSPVAHGMRSSFRDWMARTGVPEEIAKLAIAHVRERVEAAYARDDLLERRRPVMDAWAAYLTPGTSH